MSKSQRIAASPVAPVTFAPQTGPNAGTVTIIKGHDEAAMLTMSVDDVEAFAQEAVTAFGTYERAIEKASKSKMESVRDACAYLPKGITAADYERLTGKALRGELATAVKRGKMSQGTAAKVGSQLKAVALAIANGWKPEEGLGFLAAYEQAVKELLGPSYAHVYGETPKRGAKAGSISQQAKPATASALAALVPTPENASPSQGASPSPSAPEFKGDAKLAAALILTNQNRQRADKLVVVMGSFVAEFDKWAATILEAK